MDEIKFVIVVSGGEVLTGKIKALEEWEEHMRRYLLFSTPIRWELPATHDWTKEGF